MSYKILLSDLLIIVFVSVLADFVSIDMASLFFILVQTIAALAAVLNLGEGDVMKRRFLVVSGTHGAVHVP